jgi:hypothetical protein
MPGQAARTPSAPDDIDLLLLLERTIKFFRRYKWLFAAAIVLGLVTGFLIYKSKPKIYRSRMILHSVILTNQEYIQVVRNWDDLRKGAPGILASEFGLPDAITGKLKKISAEEIQKVFTPTNPHGFIIDVLVTDNSILDELEAGIARGFEKSAYVNERVRIRRDKLVELIDKTTSEIRKLDSTRNVIDRIILGKSPGNPAVIIDGANINRQWIELNEKLLHFKEELKFSQAVNILQGFSELKNPVGPNPMVWLFLGLVAFLSLAWIYATVNTISGKLKDRTGR